MPMRDPTPAEVTPPQGRLTADGFRHALLMNLAMELEAVTGVEKGREIVGLVGIGMAEAMERAAAREAGVDPDTHEWAADDLARVLVALKDGIGGEFSVESAEPDEVVLHNTRCPFGEDVEGRPSLCMMTSSVFGGIAARHFGRAEVDVDKAIARGDGHCRVRVRLNPRTLTPGPWRMTYHGADDV